MVNFALMQMNIDFCQPELNFARAKRMFAEAMSASPRPDVVVLPEDWSYGFSDEMYHHMDQHVEPWDGPSITLLKELAKEYSVWVVAGSIATIHADGNFRNTTFLLNRDGETVGWYDKMHLYSDMDEDFMLKHGEKMDVFETEVGRLGLMICYDIRFCELARTYALKGAQAVVVTSDFPNPRVNHWKTLLTARAIENQMYIVACNRMGPSPMGTYCGHSIVIDPWGEILAEADDSECVIHASIELEKIDAIRDTIHVFHDRRPETYAKGVLLNPQK